MGCFHLGMLEIIWTLIPEWVVTFIIVCDIKKWSLFGSILDCFVFLGSFKKIKLCSHMEYEWFDSSFRNKWDKTLTFFRGEPSPDL